MIGNAVKVMRIATGEIEEDTDSPRSAAAMLGMPGGAVAAVTLIEAFARACL